MDGYDKDGVPIESSGIDEGTKEGQFAAAGIRAAILGGIVNVAVGPQPMSGEMYYPGHSVDPAAWANDVTQRKNVIASFSFVLFCPFRNFELMLVS